MSRCVTCIAKNLNLRMEDARVVLGKINEMRQLMSSYMAGKSKQSMLDYKSGAIYELAMSILQYFPVVRGANPNKVGLNSDSYRLPNGTLRVDKKKLGEGTFGVVYAGSMTNERSKISIAVKYPLVKTGWMRVSKTQKMGGTQHTMYMKEETKRHSQQQTA